MIAALGAPPAQAAATSTLVAGWRRRLRATAPRVGLADGVDERAVTAAANLAAEGSLRPVLFGRREDVEVIAGDLGVTIGRDAVFDVDSLGRTLFGTLNATYARRSGAVLPVTVADPLELSVAALRAGLLDAVVAGANRTTADVLRCGMRVLGPAHDVRTVSSCFLMVLPDGSSVVFADCAVLPEPTADQLADIAVAASGTYRALTGDVPRVAMLSFSTMGSATHPGVQKVRLATELARARLPGVAVDGELQFDAAFVDSVAVRKAPGSPVAGRANVFVFPNLDAGNIGYKLVERIGNAVALGPILQGLRAPLLDLSRGCSVADIELLAVISAVQAVA